MDTVGILDQFRILGWLLAFLFLLSEGISLLGLEQVVDLCDVLVPEHCIVVM